MDVAIIQASGSSGGTRETSPWQRVECHHIHEKREAGEFDELDERKREKERVREREKEEEKKQTKKREKTRQ